MISTLPRALQMANTQRISSKNKYKVFKDIDSMKQSKYIKDSKHTIDNSKMDRQTERYKEYQR